MQRRARAGRAAVLLTPGGMAALAESWRVGEAEIESLRNAALCPAGVFSHPGASLSSGDPAARWPSAHVLLCETASGRGS